MTLTIDVAACTRCGECARDCPSRSARALPDGPYFVDQETCIHCGHCAAVCPVDAVLSDEGPFAPWERPEIEPEKVAALLRGKRSVRRYASRPVPPAYMEEILLTGSLTATASNVQDCTAMVLSGDSLAAFHGAVSAFYARIERLLRSPVVRFVLLFTEARRYALRPRSMEGIGRLARSRLGGDDRLLHNAPMAVVLSAPRRHKRYGRADCTLAGAHMTVHAESLGLGSCMIGFAESALDASRRLRRIVGIPEGHRVGLVFTLGFPVVRYRRLPQRSPLTRTDFP